MDNHDVVVLVRSYSLIAQMEALKIEVESLKRLGKANVTVKDFDDKANQMWGIAKELEELGRQL